MTTVTAIADLHGLLPEELPEADLLVVAGDVCPVSDHSLDFQLRWLEDPFAEWLERLPHPEVAWIAGNHDFVCQSEDWTPPGRGHYLRDQRIELCGLSIYGTPWVPNLPAWAFHATEPELEQRFAAIPPVDLLISHGPPLGIGDRVTYGARVGSAALKRRIADARPALCTFGHIHESHGVTRKDGTLYANVAAVDELYEPRPGAARRFRIADGRAERMG